MPLQPEEVHMNLYHQGILSLEVEFVLCVLIHTAKYSFYGMHNSCYSQITWRGVLVVTLPVLGSLGHALWDICVLSSMIGSLKLIGSILGP